METLIRTFQLQSSFVVRLQASWGELWRSLRAFMRIELLRRLILALSLFFVFGLCSASLAKGERRRFFSSILVTFNRTLDQTGCANFIVYFIRIARTLSAMEVLNSKQSVGNNVSIRCDSNEKCLKLMGYRMAAISHSLVLTFQASSSRDSSCWEHFWLCHFRYQSCW